jgi:DNA-directed RNA polymerase specialized sigma24 family protein
MDRHLGTPELEQAISDALAGARSLRLTGWVAEECEAAALERIARYWPDGARPEDPSKQPPYAPSAFLIGKRAAVDELRRLTRWRRTVRMREVPFDGDDNTERHDLPWTEAGYEVVELSDQLARGASRLRPRDQLITLALAGGFTAREVAAALRVSPSIVSVALRRVRTAFRWT